MNDRLNTQYYRLGCSMQFVLFLEGTLGVYSMHLNTQRGVKREEHPPNECKSGVIVLVNYYYDYCC